MENVVHSASGISVIIPTYNACKTIKRCIQSVIDTGYTPLEIIIADDASTDDTSLVVESIIKTKPNKVLLVQLGKNGGPARARNFGAEKATYDYLFFSTAILRCFLTLCANSIKEYLMQMQFAAIIIGNL